MTTPTPADIARYIILDTGGGDGFSMIEKPDGDVVLYTDHLAALTAARDAARREAIEACAKHLEALARARMKIAPIGDESFTFFLRQAELLESAAGEIRAMSSPAQAGEERAQ